MEARTVVVSGVPGVLPAGRMVDKLTIHFQSCRRSRGGDVESVRYPTDMDGVAFVTFDEAKDAERVAGKKRHTLTDAEFPCDYRLTVFPFTRDVFLYVPSATLDLSAFGGDPSTLIQSLRSAHRSLRIQFPPQRENATVEGPFSAVQALRQDLIRRAGRLDAAEPRETPVGPGVTSHREVGGSVGCNVSAAQPGPGSSQGEATEVQSPLSSGKAGSEEVSRESSGEERQRLGIPGGRSTELPRAESIQAPGADGAPDKRAGPDSRSAPEIRAENPSVWVDSYTYRYVEKFHAEELGRCLRGLEARVDELEGGGLVRIEPTERPASRTGSRVRLASESLAAMVESRSRLLRVHRIDLDEAPPGRRTLMKICDDVSALYPDVLYLLEDSCVKVIGPSIQGHLFCRRVEERVARPQSGKDGGEHV